MIAGKYTGDLKEGVRDGNAKLEWSNGDYYEGEFRNGLRHGFGVMIEMKGKRKYEGNWSMSQRNGRGAETFPNGDIYNGEFADDLFNGQGELVTRGGRYKGSFKDGLRNGFGTMQFSKDNARYEGNWLKGRFDGKGMYIWPDGRKYDGMWINGERTGAGLMFFLNGEKYGSCSFLLFFFNNFTIVDSIFFWS